MGIPKGRRRIVVAVVALLAIGAVAATVYRVFAPAEVSTVAQTSYPPVADPAVGPVGRLPAAPLIVNGRLRVYATTRQVYADQPVDGRHRNTPYWLYRRWPAQLSGVVASGTTVVSRWSDGRLVALDARTGRVVWRADGPAPERGYTGRRTGAATVWAPDGLHTAIATNGQPVVITVGEAQARGIELATGRQLWQVALDLDCRTDVGTTTAGRLAMVDRCTGPPAVEFRDVATGTVTARWRPPGAGAEPMVLPVGCATGRSQCRALQTAGTVSGGGDGVSRGWLIGAGTPVAAPGLAAPGTVLAGEFAVDAEDGVVSGRSARTGKQVWRRDDLGVSPIIAVQPGRVHLLTEANDLVTLDPSSGAERSRFPLTVGRDGTGWAAGSAYAADGYLAVERLKEPADPDDRGYYLTAEPVVLAAT